jgi:HlyD family secretion protein
LKKTTAILLVVFIGIFAAWWYFVKRGAGSEAEVIYRTEKVRKGDATLSFMASGVLQPLTIVDVKSKAGGVVTKLAVDEGSIVRQGDLVAVIDPRDTRANYEQASADLNSAMARQDQSRQELAMQLVQSGSAVANAQAALNSARLRLATLEDKARIQPQITENEIRQAQANYDLATQTLAQLQKVTIPQARIQAKGDFDRTKADLDAARANNERYVSLLQKGYVSQAAADQARSAYESAVAAHSNAAERQRRLEDDLRLQEQNALSRVKQARASLDQAKANTIAIGVSARDLKEAAESVVQAEAALRQAIANKRQVAVREADIRAAQAAVVRSRVSRDNAKVQLDSTTVVAPRDGVIVKKFLEEGTIIPPGTSVFSQGPSIVQIADTSKMYVEVLVDEADIAKVKIRQTVRVRLESNPRTPINGFVSRINPSADTTNGVTQVKVRVEVHETGKVKLMPGLNASCEFIEHERKDVLVVPSQAVKRENEKTYVEVMVAPNKPVRRDVKLGVAGNSSIEVLDGLKDGEEVVTSKIDMKQIEEQQRKMEEASQQRNPFSGGGSSGARSSGGGGGMGGIGRGGMR